MYKNIDLYLWYVVEKNRYYISQFWNKIVIFVEF